MKFLVFSDGHHQAVFDVLNRIFHSLDLEPMPPAMLQRVVRIAAWPQMCDHRGLVKGDWCIWTFRRMQWRNSWAVLDGEMRMACERHAIDAETVRDLDLLDDFILLKGIWEVDDSTQAHFRTLYALALKAHRKRELAGGGGA
jgi:hypothetical protein